MKTILKTIKVDGYKNLVDCHAELDSLNVLVGPNNSGKSNFLEVFTFVANLLVGSEDFRKNIFEVGRTPRGISSVCHIEGHKNKPIKVIFVVESATEEDVINIEYSLSVACKDIYTNEKEVNFIGFLNETLTYKNKAKPGKATIMFSRKKNDLKIRTSKGNFVSHKLDNFTSAFSAVRILSKDFEKSDINLIDALSSILNVLNVHIISASPNELRHKIGEEKISSIGFVHRTTSFDILPVIKEINSDDKLFQNFKDILCKILDLEDAKFISFKIPDHMKLKDVPEEINWLSLKPHGQSLAHVSEFSDGTLIVLAILSFLFSPSKKTNFVCIEEPENCLHPKALKVLITFLKAQSETTQLLITTHSPSVLNQVSPENVIVARVFDDGGTRFERIENINELNKKLRKGYISFGDLLEGEFSEDNEVIF